MTLSDIIPDSDYRFQMRLEPMALGQFFGPTDEHERLIGERRYWLAAAAHTYAALSPDGPVLLAETLELLETPEITAGIVQNSAETDWERCVNLGQQLEPDFLLLRSSADSDIRLCGGCVCFPSSWSLAEKLGHPIEFIHGVVPGLNTQIGDQIRTFLIKLKPGLAWTRTN
jgi:hypothetical protein